MKTKWIITALMLLPACGCTGMNNTQQGGLTGGLLGAGIGALAGGPRHAAAGALIGGGVGAIAGAGIGADRDRWEERKRDQAAHAVAVANAQAARQMSVAEIIQMSQQRTADDVIIRQIESTGSVFQLTSNDILNLQNHNVSSRVILAMQTPRRATVVVPQRPVVVYEPRPYYMPPPPPVSYEVGVIYRR